MNAKQAKRVWEKRYNVIVTIGRTTVEVISLCDLTKSITFEFVPPMMGEKTSWFSAIDGKRIKRPGNVIRKMAGRRA